MTVIVNNGKITMNSGCLPDGPWAPTCGSKVTENNSTIHQCCCDGSMCNDEAFMEKCKAEALDPQPEPEEDLFQCHRVVKDSSMLKATLQGKRNCSKCKSYIKFIYTIHANEQYVKFDVHVN